MVNGVIDELNANSKLSGVVLAGGKSKRMGSDKGLIKWHNNIPHRYYLANLLKKYCHEVFISCRIDQAEQIFKDGFEPLPDSADATGQYGAILSAFERFPNRAWIVVACDIPLVQESTLRRLIKNREPKSLVTAYKSEEGLPEPLIAIWEPKSKQMLEDMLQKGISCPRKALIKNVDKVKLISPRSSNELINANTPEVAKRIELLIKNNSV